MLPTVSDNIIFIVGGSIDAPAPRFWKYCITEVKCPINDQACNDYC